MKLVASRWKFLYSKGVPSSPTQEGSGFKFDFPKKPGQIDYLQTNYRSAMRGSFSIRGFVELDGELWAADDDVPPCHFSLLVRKGNELYNEWYRFWYFHFPIVNGPFDISVPFDYRKWIGVLGRTNRNKFQQLISAPSAIGLTFGGKSFAGHGVGMKSGRCTFHVSAIEIS